LPSATFVCSLEGEGRRSFPYTGPGAIAVPLDQVYHPHKDGAAVRFKMASIEFGTGDPLDAGSALVSRLAQGSLKRTTLALIVC